MKLSLINYLRAEAETRLEEKMEINETLAWRKIRNKLRQYWGCKVAGDRGKSTDLMVAIF